MHSKIYLLKLFSWLPGMKSLFYRQCFGGPTDCCGRSIEYKSEIQGV